MSSKIQKRKHKTLTIKEKSDILDRLNRNESLSRLAREYGVGRSTIYDIKKNNEKIKTFVSTSDCGPGKRQTLKKAAYPKVEEALYMWFLQKRNRHATITGPMLAMKATFFYRKIMKKKDFVASKGWLESFKSRHGIRLTSITEEKLSKKTAFVEPFKKRFLEKVKDLDLSPSQVYNAAESGLYWRIIPATCLSYNKDSASDRKMSKERVTILPCANAAGTHTLKIVVVGKAGEPKILKNMNLPVHYYEQKNAWMTKDIFKMWFYECFVPEVRNWLKNHNLPEKALLVLDNTPGHPSEIDLTTSDKCFTAMFFPSNCSAVIEPMNQHVTQFVKQDYKKNLLLSTIAKDQPIVKTLKEFNMKDLVLALCQSWIALPQSTITSSWEKLWPNIVTTKKKNPEISVPSEIIKKVAAATHISSEDLEIWFRGIDRQENIFYDMTDEEIVEHVSNCSTISQEDKDEAIASTSQKTA